MDVLISEVKKRPALWNKSHKFYRQRVYADQSWDAISKMTGISSRLAKDKWKNLRDHFKREVHKLPSEIKNDPVILINAYTGRWKYFSQLMFLLDFVRPLDFPKMDGVDTDENITENDEGNNPDFDLERDTLYEDDARSYTSSLTSKRDGNTLGAGNSANDADLHFLKSLLPYFKELPPLKKLQVRTQFENVLMKELASINEESSKLEPTDTVIKLEQINTDFD